MWGGQAGGCRVGVPPVTLPTFVPSYEVQLGDSLMSMSGCSMECWKDVVEKACCPGYWGSQCYGIGGGPALLLILQPWVPPSVASACITFHSFSKWTLSEHQHSLAALGRGRGCPEPLGSGVNCKFLGAQLSSGGGGGWFTECPGGAETPCNGRGTCLDGIDGNGTCVCQVRAW